MSAIVLLHKHTTGLQHGGGHYHHDKGPAIYPSVTMAYTAQFSGKANSDHPLLIMVLPM